RERRPFLMASSKTLVGFRKLAAERAFAMAMFAAAENVLSSRSRNRRLPPSSTTAMAPPALFLFASASATAATALAPARLRVFLSTVCADVAARAPPTIKNPNTQQTGRLIFLLVSVVILGTASVGPLPLVPVAHRDVG